MSDVKTLPAPEIRPRRAMDISWNPECVAFWKMHDELLADYENKVVAIHQGKVVAHGTDKISVAVEAMRKIGNVPTFVQLVTRNPPVPERISPDLAKKWLG